MSRFIDYLYLAWGRSIILTHFPEEATLHPFPYFCIFVKNLTAILGWVYFCVHHYVLFVGVQVLPPIPRSLGYWSSRLSLTIG